MFLGRFPKAVFHSCDWVEIIQFYVHLKCTSIWMQNLDIIEKQKHEGEVLNGMMACL